MKTIAVAGAGFAGLWAALGAARQANLSNSDVLIKLISPQPFLTIRPRLYQCNPEALAVPLARTLNPVGVEHIPAAVDTIDRAGRVVHGTDSRGQAFAFPCDRLVLAMGSQLKEPPIVGLHHALAIDDIASALRFDAHLKKLSDGPGPDSVVILGGGFSGIELALEMRSRLTAHLGDNRAQAARVVLVDSVGIGATLGSDAQTPIRQALMEANIECRDAARVVKISADCVEFDDASTITCQTVVNTMGLQAHGITGGLNLPIDSSGRLEVDANLRADDWMFAAGDIAAAYADDEHTTLMSCQHAMPMGKCAGANAVLDLLGAPLIEYRQPDYVTCLDLGDAGALLTQGWDRKLVMVGQEAKALKNQINTKWIYPPVDNAEAILEAAAMDWHPSQVA